MYWSFEVYQFLTEERVTERRLEDLRYRLASQAPAQQGTVGLLARLAGALRNLMSRRTSHPSPLDEGCGD
jgi:hypothetical protein